MTMDEPTTLSDDSDASRDVRPDESTTTVVVS